MQGLVFKSDLRALMQKDVRQSMQALFLYLIIKKATILFYCIATIKIYNYYLVSTAAWQGD
jgi:hypothetical protein